MRKLDIHHEMQRIADKLLRHQAAASDRDPGIPAESRVLEALRRPLCTVMGVQGYRVLLQRALTLESVNVPSLAAVTVNPDGSLAGFGELNPDEITAAGIAVTAQLLVLLATFVGEGLMLRILSDVWPGRTFHTSASGENE